MTDKIIRATTLTGTADEIVDAIHNMKKAGIHQVAIQPIIDNKKTVEIFAKEIIARVG